MSELRFIDRVREIEAFKDWASESRATPLYIYGPEGCGKTRLLREFVKRFNDFFMDGVAVYIDALEDRDVRKALTSSMLIDISKIGLEASMDLLQQNIPLGHALSRSISLIIDKIAEKTFRRSFKNKYILVIIDDVVRAIGLDRVEYYVKWLYELRWKLEGEYKPKAINFIVTTSEGGSLRLIFRHRHTHPKFIWNLDKKSFEELFYELTPPPNVKIDDVWSLLGGNPGKLVELAKDFRWSLESMVEIYTGKLKDVVTIIYSKGLTEELKALINNPDNGFKTPTESMLILIDILTEANLFMRTGITLAVNSGFKPDKEIGIGEDFGWQIPMYRDILLKLLKKFGNK